MKKVCMLVVFVVLFPLISVAASGPALPKGYTAWTKSERKVDNDKNSLYYGAHYIYADKKAMKGYQAGNRFEEGSTIIVDYYNFKSGSTADGAKSMVVLMRKDKRKKETMGWVFAGFNADGKPSGLNPVTTCISCHKKDASQRDFVISTIKDFKR